MAKRKRLYLQSGMRQNAAGKRHVRHPGGGGGVKNLVRDTDPVE